MSLTAEDFENRARQLAERVEGDRPESWQPRDAALGHPQVLIGTLIRVDPAQTTYGPTKVVVLRDGAGKDWAVWLIHQVLADEIKRLAPQPGELVAVKYGGTVHRPAPAADYESFRVEVDRADGAVDWDALPAVAVPAEASEHHEPAPPQAAEPAGADVARFCEQCGFRDPDHAENCIPF
jgi:hypothetical protein